MARKRNQVEEPIEIIDEEKGQGLDFDFGIILGTTITLLGAVVLIMIALAENYDRGLLGG